MKSNNKMIGVALIIIGIAFIALGVWSGLPKSTTKTPTTNTEQNGPDSQQTNVNDSIYLENINVYTEGNDQETTRYIY